MATLIVALKHKEQESRRRDGKGGGERREPTRPRQPGDGGRVEAAPRCGSTARIRETRGFVASPFFSPSRLCEAPRHLSVKPGA